MSLRGKILFVHLAGLVLYGLVHYYVYQLFIVSNYREMEKTEAIKNTSRCVNAIFSEIQRIDDIARNIAASEENYPATEIARPTARPGRAAEKPGHSLFALNEIDLVYYVEDNGTVLWGEIHNHDNDLERALDEFPRTHLDKSDFLLHHGPSGSGISGIMLTSGGALIVSSYPVSGLSMEGRNGSFIIGQFLGREEIADLASRINLDFQLIASTTELTSSEERLVASLDKSGGYHVSEAGEFLQVYTTIPVLNRTNKLVLRTRVPAIVGKRERASIRFATLAILVFSFLLLALLYVFIQRKVINPISTLTHDVVRIGRGETLSLRLPANKDHDEMDVLHKEFIAMIRQLTDTRNRLIEQSYYSGMSEMAAGILHNVSNAFNPMLLKIEGSRAHFEKINLRHLRASLAELLDGQPQGQRRSDLRYYVDLFLDRIENEWETFAQNCDSIRRQAGIIERLLSQQRNFTAFDYPMLSFSLAELINDAMLMIKKTILDAVTVHVDVSVPDLGEIRTNRIILLQIMANIIQNAAESIRKTVAGRGTVTITAAVERINDREIIQIVVSDDGDGIAPDDLERIFERGYTTKEHGSVGFGLHWCFNSILSLQGGISATSAGKGRGAALHICLPRDGVGGT